MTPADFSYDFNPRHHRARLAVSRRRYYHLPLIIVAILLAVGLLAGGIALLVTKDPLGWIFASLSAPFLMLFLWLKIALRDIPVSKHPTSITDLLTEDILASLHSDSTPTDLARLIPRTRSGNFLMSRFYLPEDFFVNVAAELPQSLSPLFTTAHEIMLSTKSTAITPAILGVAMLQNYPEHGRLLAVAKLDLSDFHQGIIWYNRIVQLSQKRHHRTGGIGRDFDFGFTPTLEHFAVNLSSIYAGSDFTLASPTHREILNSILQIFSAKGRQSLAIVGGHGSGRSAIVNALAATLMDPSSKLPSTLKYRQIFSLDAPSLISATRSQGELQHLLISIFNEIVSARNIILCLDGAHLFFEEGPGSIDISNFLIPIIEGGHVRLILIMDDQKFLEISARTPALTSAIQKISVPPTDESSTMQILMETSPLYEHQNKVVYTYRALKEAYRLAARYTKDATMPGAVLHLLESAAHHAEGSFVTDISVQSATEAAYGVKIKVATSAEDRDRLLNLEALIHERMIDQAEAVSAVSSALRRAAAGVKNTGRPIGTFLFLGPTGVGKTELAKSLAAAYFGSEKDIVRLDINEFVSPTDVSRLIASTTADPNGLVAQISKHPFSVVLLDEIEKAHPSVLTTLLQVLDEGILRDSNNQEISFRDAIIIATSNAGANEIRDYIATTGQIAGLKDPLVNHLISTGEFKPEFLNRFDEICLFKPLSRADLLQILNLIIVSTNQTLSTQNITISLDDSAKSLLLEKGYDPQMGARPMRRLVQQTVENLVATAILSGRLGPGSHLTITAADLTDISQGA